MAGVQRRNVMTMTLRGNRVQPAWGWFMLMAAAVAGAMLSSTATAQVTNTYSAYQFTTLNSATFTLSGLNGMPLTPQVLDSLSAPAPSSPFNTPGSSTSTTLTYGTGFWSGYHKVQTIQIPGGSPIVYSEDWFGYDWDYLNTGFTIEIEFNVTFAQAAQFTSGSTAWFQNPSGLTANGTALNQNDILSAGTHTLNFVWNTGVVPSNTGTDLRLGFKAVPSAIPGSGLAAVGSLGLAGLARRRRR